MELWQHQQGAIDFTLANPLAWWRMGMSTGKTLTALELISRADIPRSIIVCPKKVIDVWLHEVKKWNYGYDVYALNSGSVPQRIETVKNISVSNNPAIIVINYEAAMDKRFVAAAIRFNPVAVFADESHRIKGNNKTNAAVCAFSQHSKYRPALTGTPFPNSHLDAFGQMRFIDPRIFPRYESFLDRYAVRQQLPDNPRVRIIVGYKNHDDLSRRIAPYMYVVNKEDAVDLPPLHIIKRKVNLENRAQKYYSDLDQEFFLQLQQGVITVDNILVMSTRLHQLIGGWLTTDNGNQVQVSRAKLDAALAIAEDLDEKLVIFCKFRNEINSLIYELRKIGKSVGEISGKANDYLKWKEGALDVIVAQSSSGAEGIDLTEASYGIIYSMDYSGGKYMQAISRLHRKGASKKVTIYDLVVDNTIDEDISDGINDKLEMSEKIINGVQRRNSPIKSILTLN